jgi:hypothetical protein
MRHQVNRHPTAAVTQGIGPSYDTAQGGRMSRRVPSRTADGDRVHAAHPAYSEQTRSRMFYELQYVRREAQAEAQLAYDAWCRLPGRDGYAVYRAAQDRADAAEDELAALVRGSQADPTSG